MPEEACYGTGAVPVALTTTGSVADTPDADALTSASPAVSACTAPVALTCATVGLDEDHAAATPDTASPRALIAVAERATLSPTSNVSGEVRRTDLPR
jgi:hypothetical protein